MYIIEQAAYCSSYYDSKIWVGEGVKICADAGRGQHFEKLTDVIL